VQEVLCAFPDLYAVRLLSLLTLLTQAKAATNRTHATAASDVVMGVDPGNKNVVFPVTETVRGLGGWPMAEGGGITVSPHHTHICRCAASFRPRLGTARGSRTLVHPGGRGQTRAVTAAGLMVG
jgi:hypothetical protein